MKVVINNKNKYQWIFQNKTNLLFTINIFQLWSLFLLKLLYFVPEIPTFHLKIRVLVPMYLIIRKTSKVMYLVPREFWQRYKDSVLVYLKKISKSGTFCFNVCSSSHFRVRLRSLARVGLRWPDRTRTGLKDTKIQKWIRFSLEISIFVYFENF